jgi:hypothetical protein
VLFPTKYELVLFLCVYVSYVRFNISHRTANSHPFDIKVENPRRQAEDEKKGSETLMFSRCFRGLEPIIFRRLALIRSTFSLFGGVGTLSGRKRTGVFVSVCVCVVLLLVKSEMMTLLRFYRCLYKRFERFFLL